LTDFNKDKVKEQLSLENIFDVISDFGGDPQYTDFGILSTTICHNPAGEGSRKLYYYSNSGLFQCFTNCGSFDIFELVIKVFSIQYDKEIDLNAAIRYIAAKFGIAGEYVVEDDSTEDWRIFESYSRIQEIETKDYNVQLKEYDSDILNNLNYSIILQPWLEEGISQEVINHARIGSYPGADQITIPHFDASSRFIGLRGRSMAQDDVDKWGKYRPLRLDKTTQFNHPLGMNLYGLNWAKDAISVLGKAIIFESEKSVLLYMSYFGIENNIAVACCGSNVSAYHIHALKEAGAKEIIIAMDRQFKEINDDEFKRLTSSLTKIHTKFSSQVQISFMFDKDMITDYKASPIDEGPEKFLHLFKNRVYLS
jgi:hypothetical protein